MLRCWLELDEQRTRRALARISRVPERRIYAILSGEQQAVQFNTADRLLCAIEQVEEWHLSLADLYELPAVSERSRGRRMNRSGGTPTVPHHLRRAA